MQFHSVAGIFPEMLPEEFASLKASIEANGQRVPIYTHEGLIVDGRHRYRACIELGIEPRCEEWDGVGSLCEFVRILNAERRHLDTGAKQMAAARFAIELEKEAEVRRLKNLKNVGSKSPIGDFDEFGKSNLKAAEKFGIGHSAVDRAIKVTKHGDDSLKQAVESGNIAVSVAAVVADLPAEEQREIVARGEAEILRAAKEIKDRKKEAKDQEREAKQKQVEQISQTTYLSMDMAEDNSFCFTEEMLLGSWTRNGHKLVFADNTNEKMRAEILKDVERVALAFADPPYNSTSEDWDGDHVWSQDFLSSVADIVAVTPGISSIQSFMQTTKMKYRWSTATWITNGMARGALGFGNWIYTAIFSDQSSIYRNEQDFSKISIKLSDKFEDHVLGSKRQKPPEYLTWLFLLFAKPGDTIFDPFAGSGTSIIVADQLGMNCIAMENDWDTYRQTVHRLENYFENKQSV